MPSVSLKRKEKKRGKLISGETEKSTSSALEALGSNGKGREGLGTPITTECFASVREVELSTDFQ